MRRELQRFTLALAVGGTVAALVFGFGSAAPARADASSNDVVWWGVGYANCNNCSALVDVQAWSSSLASPIMLSVISGNCTASSFGYHGMAKGPFTSLGFWYARAQVDVLSYYCSGVGYRLTFSR
jgi:hypothetical protein